MYVSTLYYFIRSDYLVFELYSSEIDNPDMIAKQHQIPLLKCSPEGLINNHKIYLK